jgi:DNA ligase-1
MRLADVVATSAAVAGTSSRLEKIAHLADLLSRADSDDISLAVAYLSGSLRQGRIGVGGSRIFEARAPAAARASSLTLADVDAAFQAIATTGGRGSSAEKTRLLAALLAKATSEEQDFLVRLLFGELRQGALDGVLVEAVARAAHLAPSAIRRAAMMAGNLPLVSHAALTGGADALAAYSVQLFRPVQPMLALSADSLEEALALVPDPALDIKMDGARIQVHKAGAEVRVYTRNLRDVTGAVPEVVEAIGGLGVSEVILDGEVIALTADGSPHPFQVTMRRFGRRLDIDALRRELPLTPLFFDCLHVNGRVLIDEPWRIRREILTDVLPEAMRMPCLVDGSPAEAETFLAGALDRGHEGVMVKAKSAAYAAGNRGQAWVKVKTARTLDLVVLAAEWGHGRRKGWLSNLHLGARDEAGGGFVMLGKTFKGLTDEMLAWQTKRFLELESSRDEYTVYVRPEVVVEIAFNELQESPRYAGGLALRFARVKAFREDKSPAEADTFTAVQAIFRRMSGKQPPQPA